MLDDQAVSAERSIDAVFREESGRILATLIRIAGSFDLAEEAMQEAFTVALDRVAAKRRSPKSGRVDHGCGPSQVDRPNPA